MFKMTMFAINMSYKQPLIFDLKTEYDIGFPIYENLQKYISLNFLPSKNVMQTFQLDGGHFRILNFQALSAIC